MESQPQNPEFRTNPENFHPCSNIQADGRPKIMWKKSTEKECCEWKSTTVNPQERSAQRSVVRSAMRAATLRPPTDVDDAPAPVC